MSIKRAVIITYHDDSGEIATIELTKRFEGENNLMKADVLQDAIEELQHIYDESLEAYHKDLSAMADAVNAAPGQA